MRADGAMRSALRQMRMVAWCLCVVFAAGATSGCAGLGAAIGLDREFVDYARDTNGARLTASAEDKGHRAATLIDGITDPALWDEGQGWQTTFEYTAPGSRFRASAGSIEDRIGRGSAWVQISLPELTIINRVVIHALDTLENPFPGYDDGALQVFDPSDAYFPWKTVARLDEGHVVVQGRQTREAGPTTTFRFNQISGNAVQFVVFGMRDTLTQSLATAEAQSYTSPFGRTYYLAPQRTQETTVRLLEIEVTGTESRPKDGAASEGSGESEIGSILMEDLRSGSP